MRSNDFSKGSINKYFSDLIIKNNEQLDEGKYFWPRHSGQKDLQSWIVRKHGISDYDSKNSRSELIIGQINFLLSKGLLKPNFSVIDICCGDAIILMQIKKAFPKCMCYGVDIVVGEIGIHSEVQSAGVDLHKVLIQDLFSSEPPRKFDVAIMLNSYRNWTWRKELHNQNDSNLSEMADRWFGSNAVYTILTVSLDQVSHLKKYGFKLQYIGRGESQSAMVCLSMHDELPFKLRSSFSLWLYIIRKSIGKLKRKIIRV